MHIIYTLLIGLSPPSNRQQELCSAVIVWSVRRKIIRIVQCWQFSVVLCTTIIVIISTHTSSSYRFLQSNHNHMSERDAKLYSVSPYSCFGVRYSTHALSLYQSAVRTTSKVNRKCQISGSASSETLGSIFKKNCTVDYVVDPTPHANIGTISSKGACLRMREIVTLRRLFCSLF